MTFIQDWIVVIFKGTFTLVSKRIYNDEKYVIVTKPRMSFLAITVCAFVVLDVPKAGTIWDIFLLAACLYIFGNLSILRLCPLLIFYWHSTGRSTTTRELTSQVYLDKNANQRKFKYNIPLHHIEGQLLNLRQSSFVIFKVECLFSVALKTVELWQNDYS